MLEQQERRWWFLRHFQNYLELSPWRFFWQITAESFVVACLAAVLVHAVVPEPERDLSLTSGEFLVVGVLVAPIVETLLSQSLPIHLVRFLRGPFIAQIFASTMIFGAVHFLEGVTTGIAAGLVGGFYLAFLYAHWCARSVWTALWMTIASHAIHNYAVFVILAATGGL